MTKELNEALDAFLKANPKPTIREAFEAGVYSGQNEITYRAGYIAALKVKSILKTPEND